MQELRIGDRVQTVSADGSVAYEDIYFFGHRSANEMGSFVKLTLEPRCGVEYYCISQASMWNVERSRE